MVIMYYQKSEPDPEWDTGPESEPDPEPGFNPESNTDPKPDPELDSNPESDTRPGPPTQGPRPRPNSQSFLKRNPANSAAAFETARSIGMRSVDEPVQKPWPLVLSIMYCASSGLDMAAPCATRITSG